MALWGIMLSKSRIVSGRLIYRSVVWWVPIKKNLFGFVASRAIWLLTALPIASNGFPECTGLQINFLLELFDILSGTRFQQLSEIYVHFIPKLQQLRIFLYFPMRQDFSVTCFKIIFRTVLNLMVNELEQH